MIYACIMNSLATAKSMVGKANYTAEELNIPTLTRLAEKYAIPSKR